MVQRWIMQRQIWYFSRKLGVKGVKAADNVAAEEAQCQIMGGGKCGMLKNNVRVKVV